MKKDIKYIFEVAHRKEKFKIRNQAKSFNELMKKFNILLLTKGYFKGCKVKFRCVEMIGKKIISEIEEYKYNNGRISGFSTNWEGCKK